MMIDEVDYDSNSPGVPIFIHSLNMVKSQQEVRSPSTLETSPSTLETSNLEFPSTEIDTSLINNKCSDHKNLRRT